MSLRETLLARISAYCATHGLAESEFGRRANGVSHLVRRIRAGRATLASIEAAERLLDTPPTATAPAEADQVAA
jgi:hypothetical protein